MTTAVIILCAPVAAYLLVLWAVRGLDPNRRTPEQARREAMEARLTRREPVEEHATEVA